MKKHIKDERGFSAVETLLVVVIVAIVAFVGWFVYHSNQKANSTINAANQSSSVQSISLTSTKTTSAASTRAKSIATALLVYVKTNKNEAVTTYLKSYVDKHVNDGQFTSSFKTAADNGTAFSSGDLNPVYCSNGIAPTSFKVTNATLSGNTATVDLDQMTSSTDTGKGPELMLNYVNNNWSVNSYSCPQ